MSMIRNSSLHSYPDSANVLYKKKRERRRGREGRGGERGGKETEKLKL